MELTLPKTMTRLASRMSGVPDCIRNFGMLRYHHNNYEDMRVRSMYVPLEFRLAAADVKSELRLCVLPGLTGVASTAEVRSGPSPCRL